MAEKNNLKIEFIECPFARCLTLAETGEIDILSGLLKTPERQKYLKYIEPGSDIHTGRFNFYYLADSVNQDITELSQLEGKFVGSVRGARHIAVFDDNKQIVKVELVDNVSVVKLLLAQRIDYIIYSGSEFEQLLVEFNATKIIKRATLEFRSSALSYFALSNHSAELLKPLSATFLQLVQTGQLKLIAQKHGLIPN